MGDILGNILNPLTQPFGLKLFPGGPYADLGAGDKALSATEQAKQEALGVLTGQDWESLLTQEESQMFNRQTDALAQAAEAAIANIKASAAERGLPDSYVQAFEQRIRDNLIGQQTDLRVGLYNLVEQKRKEMANIITGAGTQTAQEYMDIGQQQLKQSGEMQSLLYSILGQVIGAGNLLPGVFGGAASGTGNTGTVGGAGADTTNLSGFGTETGVNIFSPSTYGSEAASRQAYLDALIRG